MIGTRTAIIGTGTAMREIVWPALAPQIGGGTIITVEGSNDGTAMLLDRDAGIDALWLRPHLGIAGLATRVGTWTGMPTFTLRHFVRPGVITEMGKRTRAYDSHGLAPGYTVQAYLEGRILRAAAVCQTRVLVQACLDGEAADRTNPRDGIRFWSIPFADVPGTYIWTPESSGG